MKILDLKPADKTPFSESLDKGTKIHEWWEEVINEDGELVIITVTETETRKEKRND